MTRKYPPIEQQKYNLPFCAPLIGSAGAARPGTTGAVGGGTPGFFKVGLLLNAFAISLSI